MSCSYYANSIIGLKVFRDKIYTRQTVKAFAHDYPSDWTHDPKTGRGLWCQGDVLQPGFGGDDGVLFEGRYKVILGDSESRRPVAFIALFHGRAHDAATGVRTPIDFSLISSDIEKFKAACVKHELWEDESFGLWSYLEISY